MAQSEAALDVPDIRGDLWAGILPDTLWKGRTGRGVRVAVVDSGIDTEHPALKDRVKESVEAVPDAGQITFQLSVSGDQAGHDTACAGIITSIAPELEFYSIKVMIP